jgi:SnoaL-like domain
MSPDDVRGAVLAVVHYIDARQWKELQELFAPTVAVDYTSLFGGVTSSATVRCCRRSDAEHLLISRRIRRLNPRGCPRRCLRAVDIRSRARRHHPSPTKRA